MTKTPDERAASNAAAATPINRVPLSAIMKGQREAVIEHDGQEYRLRITASGKLILTK